MSNKNTILRMWKFADPWKFQFYFGFIGGSTFPLYFSYLYSYITKIFTEVCMDQNIAALKSTVIIIFLMLLFGLVFYPFCFGIIYITYSKISGYVKKIIFNHVQKLPVSYVEEHYSGDIIAKVTTDFSDAIQLVAYPGVGQANPFSIVFSVIAIAIVVISSNWILGMISLGICLLNLLIMKILSNPLEEKEQLVKQSIAASAQNIVNALSGTMVARIFGLDSYLQEQYKERTQEIYSRRISLVKRKSAIFCIVDFQAFATFTGVTIVGLILSKFGYIDIPSVIFIANFQIFLSEMLAEFGKKVTELQKYIAGAKRLFAFLDVAEEQERACVNIPEYDCDVAIQVEKLNFSYPNTEQKIFEDFSISIKQGENLAIVGGSGGGKSTLFKILLEFAVKQRGKITIFGHDSESYSIAKIRSFFSYVPQDCYLFDGTIEENISWGNPMASAEAIKKAAKDAYLSEFIESLPEGYATRVGERGTSLSGGQRQRIAIARAFLKNAPIILLDEATSALDSKSEEEVQIALHKLIKGRTSIVIAHRLSTIQNANRILVLEKGHVIEEGQHAVLLQQKGRYYDLYQMQFQ